MAALIESQTRKGEKSEEDEVAVSALRDARDAISDTKGQRSNDSRAATHTALGFLCGETIQKKRMKTTCLI